MHTHMHTLMHTHTHTHTPHTHTTRAHTHAQGQKRHQRAGSNTTKPIKTYTYITVVDCEKIDANVIATMQQGSDIHYFNRKAECFADIFVVKSTIPEAKAKWLSDGQSSENCHQWNLLWCQYYHCSAFPKDPF